MRLLVPAVLAVLLFSVPAHASAGEAARQYLAHIYDGRFDDLPNAEGAKTEAFERRVRNVLRTRCVEIEQISLRETKNSSEAAEVTADVWIRKRERDLKDPWVASELITLRMNLLHREDGWVVSAIEDLDQELAARLLDGGTEDALRDIPPSRLQGVTRAIYDKALAMLNAGKFEAAGQAAALAQRLARIAGDRGGEALALGVSMYAIGDADHEKAAALSRESLAIAEAAGDPDVLARAWYNYGRRLGGVSPDDAQERARADALRRASAFAERAEDPTLLIRVLYTTANAAVNVRDHLTARRHIDRILPLAREVGDVTGELAAESVLSIIYFEQGDLERGFYHNARARELAEKHQHSYAHATLIHRAAWVLVEEHRHEEARAMFARVVRQGPDGELTTTTRVAPAVFATTLLSIASMEAAEGRMDQAECLTDQAIRITKTPEGRLRHNLARGYLKRGDHAAALRVSLASLAEPSLVDQEKMGALHFAATAYRGLGEYRAAASMIREAIEIREAMDLRIAGDEQQRVHGSHRAARFYQLAAEIALDLGAPAEALIHLERGRAGVLREVLENGRPGAIATGEAAEADIRLERERELSRLSIQLDRAQRSGSASAIREATGRLDRARAEHATFLDGLRARSERRSLASPSLSEASLDDVLERLPAGAIALSYFVSDHHLHVFVARRNAPRVIHRKIAVDGDALEERVARFVDAISRRDDAFAESAAAVYELLIGPVEEDIRGAAGLVVVPDGSLWRVPFAALTDRRNRFLIERFPIVYAPSITAYTLMSRQAQRDREPAESFLGVGNPALDEASQMALVSFYRNVTLGPLPDAEREVGSVRRLYPESVVLTGRDASEGRVKEAMRGADVVHFATHALLDDRNPMYSRLALARDAAGHDDGWLEAWEIMLLQLDADLVVLSACDTATGRIGAGEGVVGIAWSFFVAGARATVATQWKVSSRGSAGLMIAFHEALKTSPAGPLRKAAALRDAQLKLMRSSPQYQHPFYWGAFVVLGDGS